MDPVHLMRKHHHGLSMRLLMLSPVVCEGDHGPLAVEAQGEERVAPGARQQHEVERPLGALFQTSWTDGKVNHDATHHRNRTQEANNLTLNQPDPASTTSPPLTSAVLPPMSQPFQWLALSSCLQVRGSSTRDRSRAATRLCSLRTARSRAVAPFLSCVT
jgi:hypothetical protein